MFCPLKKGFKYNLLRILAAKVRSLLVFKMLRDLKGEQSYNGWKGTEVYGGGGRRERWKMG